MKKLKCLFCGKDLTNETYNMTYTLFPIADDRNSKNKIAKPIHIACFMKFVELNKQIIKSLEE